MKISLLAASLFPFALLAAIPDSAQGWYTPDEYTFEGIDATWEKNGKSYGATIDSNGNVEWNQFPNDQNVRNALEFALCAYANAQWNNDEIETLGKNLHKVFSTDGITISGQTPDGSYANYTIKFKGSIGDSDTILAETEHMRWNLADQKSLELLKGNKIQISGWDLKDDETSFWNLHSGAIMTRLTPGNGGGVHYYPYYGVDGLSLAASSSSKQLQLNQWVPPLPTACCRSQTR